MVFSFVYYGIKNGEIGIFKHSVTTEPIVYPYLHKAR